VTEEVIVPIPVDTQQAIYEYGFMTDSFVVHDGRVKRNENLSDILHKYKVPYSSIHEIAVRSKDVFNVKRMRAGNRYRILCQADSANELLYFIYERNPIDYIVFQLQDSALVYTGKKDVKVKVKSASGVIMSSLYVSMVKSKLNPVLALELSEVFAWQIDFFRIQKKDRFKVIYEEKFVDGRSIGIGKILAAYFGHEKKVFYGIHFIQDDKPDYFDENGNSLRKAFLKAPLRFSRISSRYSTRRYHPILKHYRAHLGVDYAAPRGTPVNPVGDGVTVEAGYKSGNGNYVKVKHNSVYTTGYLHFSKIAGGIKKGVNVIQGQVIGYVGSTGLATGAHLCFRFFKNGSQVNPLTIEVPPSKPVEEAYKEAYLKKRDEMVKALESITFVEDQEI